MPFVLRYQLNILCRIVRGFATCRTTPAQPQMIEAADEFVDEFQLNRIFYHWSRSVPSKNGSRIPQCNFWSGYTIFASCGHKGCQLPFGYLLDMRDTSMQHLMRKPPSSRLFIYCFSLINGSCCRCQSTKARIHSCASSCVCTPFNKCTSSRSSCAATVCGLRVIHVSISRATCTVQRCRIASGHTSRTAFMMFGAPSHVTLSI